MKQYLDKINKDVLWAEYTTEAEYLKRRSLVPSPAHYHTMGYLITPTKEQTIVGYWLPKDAFNSRFVGPILHFVRRSEDHKIMAIPMTSIEYRYEIDYRHSHKYPDNERGMFICDIRRTENGFWETLSMFNKCYTTLELKLALKTQQSIKELVDMITKRLEAYEKETK